MYIRRCSNITHLGNITEKFFVHVLKRLLPNGMCKCITNVLTMYYRFK